MTRTQEALIILRDKRPQSYGQFAQLFWPDSDMHGRFTNCGNGARRGAGAFLCAGSFLGKLERKGLIFKRRYGSPRGQSIAILTEAAVKILEANR